MVEVARLDVVVKNQQAVRSANQTKTALRGVGDEAVKTASKTQGAFQRMVTSVTSFRGTLASIGIAGIFAGTLNVIRGFEKEMSTVRAVTGAVGSDFDALAEQARHLGS